MKELAVKSSAFEQNKLIPSKYTCEVKTDAPAGLFTHWLTWDLPITGKIEEHSALDTEGLNTSKKPGYTGPCPPSDTHRYFFKVCA